MTTQNISKTVKALIAAFVMILACSFSVSAQLGGRWSIGGDLGVPIGDWSNNSSLGLGVFGKFEAPIPAVAKLNWTGQIGYTNFFGKNYGGGKASIYAIPVLGGVRYYMNDRFDGFYVSGELGLSFLNAKYKYTDPQTGYTYTTTGNGTTRLTFAPGAGYHLANWDFSGKFMIQSDFTYLNLRAAYVFNKH